MKSLLLVCEFVDRHRLAALLEAQAFRQNTQVFVTHRESRREARETIHYNPGRYDGVVIATKIREEMWDEPEESSARQLHSALTAMQVPCWMVESEKSIAGVIRSLTPLRDGEYEGALVDLVWRDGVNIIPLTGLGVAGLDFASDRLTVRGTVTVRTRANGKRQVIATTSLGHTFHANATAVAQVAVRHH